MKPEGLFTRIFLDSGDPADTQITLDSMGFLDGQTTNPSLVAKNPKAQECLSRPEKCTKDEIYTLYKDLVQEVSGLVPDGSVSIEVYADANTTAPDMSAEGLNLNKWIPNAHIKLPTTAEGLKAATELVAQGLNVNMTLCFSQQQAAAVYAATAGAKKGQVFVSPFIGRLDDLGENGMDLIKNILQMYEAGDGHVEVLSASIRSLDHLMGVFAVKSDIVTCPKKILDAWIANGMNLPLDDYTYAPERLTEMIYEEISLDQSWNSFDLHHELTDKGIERFAEDWNNLIGSTS